MTDSPQQTDPGRLNLRLSGKIVMLSAIGFSVFCIGAISPVLPAIAEYFAHVPNGATLTRLLVSIVGLTMMIGAPLAGRYMDRLGPRRITVVAMACFAIAGCAGFFINDIYLLLGSRIIVGFSMAAMQAVMLVLVVRYSTGGASNRWFGYFGGMSSVANIMLTPTVGYLGTFGWHYAFLTYSVAIPLVFLAIKGFDPDPPYVPPKPVDDAAAQPKESSAASYRYLAFAMAAGAVIVGPHLYFPFRMREIGISSSQDIAQILVPSIILTGISSYLFGALRARVSMAGTFILIFISGMVGLATVAFAETPAQIIAGLLLFSIGQGVSSPNLYALAAISGPDSHRGQTMGFAKTGLFAGPLVAQLALEPVMLTYGARGALLGFIALAAILCLREVWMLVGRRRRTVAA